MKEDSVKIGKRWPSIYRPWREALEEIDPGNVLIFNFWPPDLCKIHLFLLSSLWFLVLEALAN